MKKYIKVYDDVLPEYQCNALIEKFEINKDQHVSTDLDGHRHFTEININQRGGPWTSNGFSSKLYTPPIVNEAKP